MKKRKITYTRTPHTVKKEEKFVNYINKLIEIATTVFFSFICHQLLRFSFFFFHLGKLSKIFSFLAICQNMVNIRWGKRKNLLFCGWTELDAVKNDRVKGKKNGSGTVNLWVIEGKWENRTTTLGTHYFCFFSSFFFTLLQLYFILHTYFIKKFVRDISTNQQKKEKLKTFFLVWKTDGEKIFPDTQNL